MKATAKIFFAAFIALLVLSFASLGAAWAEEAITFIGSNGNKETTYDYTIIDANTGTTWGNGDNFPITYVASGNVEISERVTVNGRVRLILLDGAKLTASKGITIPPKEDNKINSLSILGQSKGTGILIATGGENEAGIGGGNDQAGGDIDIFGGNITATGGNSGAGIGGRDIRIAGGTINATGGDSGAGIDGDYIRIEGGDVIATGNNAAGITGSNIVLGYSNKNDSIYASSYSGKLEISQDGGTFLKTLLFLIKDTNEEINSDNVNSSHEKIAGQTLIPKTCKITNLSGANVLDVPSIAAVGEAVIMTYTGEIKTGYELTFQIKDKTQEELQNELNHIYGLGYEIDSTKQKAFLMPNQDTTVSATLTPITYTIAYNLNDGTLSKDTTNPTSYTPESPDIELNKPTKTGYDFAGWTGTSLDVATETVIIKKGSSGNREYTATWTPTNYKITYTLNNGTVSTSNPESYTIESSLTLTNPTKNGYQFDGWTGTDLSSKTQTVKISNMTGDRSYTANFTPISYNITYELNGGENSSSNPAAYTIESETITLANPTKTGYDFAGWTLNGDAITEIIKGSTGDKTLTATWSVITYTISYDLDGGENSSSNLESYTINSAKITLADPKKIGYDFSGWTLDGEIITEIPTQSTGNKILIATWTPINYTISYDLNNGEVSPDNPASYTIESEDFTLKQPTLTGYDFAGWTGTSLDVASIDVTIKNGSIGDREYAATWKLAVYTISYDLKAGTLSKDNPTSYDIESDNFTLTNPTRDYYVFAGWTGTSLDAAAETVTISQGSTGNREYIATWTPITYTISYDLKAGTISKDNPTSYDIESETFTLNNPTRDSYTFAGWTGTSLDAAAETVTISQGSTGNREYIATWKPVTYAITYTLGGGSATNPTSYTTASEDFTLNNPTRTGYNFSGWTGTGLSQAAESVTIPQGSSGDRTYSATWSVTTYSISYTLNNGNASNPTSYTIESSFTLNNPTRDGYTFAGWTGTDLSGRMQSVTISNATGDRNYTANFSPITYTITYNLDGGENSSANPTSYTTEDATITLAAPTKTGYTFAGWTSGGETITSIPARSIGNRTLTATWTPITYAITYTLNNGTATNPTSYTIENSFTLNNPTRDGYTFTGWTGTDLTSETMTVTISQGSTGNRDYTANFSPISYTITYELDGGENSSANPTSYTTEDATITLAAPTRTGCTFAGWTSGGETITEIPARSIGNRTLTATWTPITYTITYTLNNGTATNPTSYTINDTFTLNNPTRDGYTFTGWTGTDLTSETMTVTISQGSTGDRDYTANFSPISYTITYNLDGGEISSGSPMSYATGSDAITLGTPTKTGYDFLGWSVDGEIITEISAGSIGDKVLTATWRETAPTISQSDYTLTAQENSPAELTITATGINLSWNISGNLPGGLSFGKSENTASITGTPETGTAGIYSVTITASNEGGSVSANVAITIESDAEPEPEPEPEPDPEEPDEPEEPAQEQEDVQEESTTETQSQIITVTNYDIDENLKIDGEEAVSTASKTLDEAVADMNLTQDEQDLAQNIEENTNAGISEIFSDGGEVNIISGSSDGVTITQTENDTTSTENNNENVALGGFQIETGGEAGIINTPLPRQDKNLWGLAVNGSFTATNQTENNNAMAFSAAAFFAADDENNVVFFDSNGNITTRIPNEQDENSNARIGGFMSMAARVEPNTTYDFVLSVPVEELREANIEVTETEIEVVLPEFTYFSTPYFSTFVSPDYILNTEFYRVSDDTLTGKENHVKIGREAWTRTEAERNLAAENNYTMITKLRSFDATPEINSHRYIIAVNFSSDKISQIDTNSTQFIFFPNGPSNKSADASKFEVLKYDTENKEFITFTPSEIEQNGTAYLAFDLDGGEIFSRPMLAANIITPASAEKFAIKITKGKITVAQGEEDSAELSAENSSGDVLYELSSNAPAWITLNNKAVKFAPTFEDNTGDYTIKITGTDAENNFASVDVAVTVTNGSTTGADFKITLSSPALNLKVNQTDAVKISSNAIGNAKYEINAPENSGAVLEGDAITVTPTKAGNFEVVISGTDDGRATDNTDTATLTVNATEDTTATTATVGSNGGGCSSGIGVFALAVLGIFIAHNKK